MKYQRLFIITLLLLCPFVTQAAFRWPWQTKPVTEQAKPVEVKKPAPIDPQILKQGTAKMRQWERLAESPYVKGKESLSVEFTAAELEAIVRDAAKKLKDAPLEPNSFTVKIIDQQIIINAVVLKPVRFNMQLTLSAQVVNGRLEPKVISAKAGLIPVSGALVERLANQIFGAKWRTELNRPQFVWEKFTISDNKILAQGKVNKKGKK